MENGEILVAGAVGIIGLYTISNIIKSTGDKSTYYSNQSSTDEYICPSIFGGDLGWVSSTVPVCLQLCFVYSPFIFDE
jgi:hypothetical protein